MTSPLVYVVLVQWRTCEDTFGCLDSLFRMAYGSLQIVLVDNGTPAMCQQTIRKRFPTVELIGNPRNLGFTGANNIGIAHAMRQGAEYILLLNNDTVVHPRLLQELLAVIAANERIGIVGPKISFYDQPDRLWYAGTKRTWLYGRPLSIVHRGFRAVDRGQYNQVEQVGFLSGCAMLIRRAVIEQIGAFDDEYFAYFEDVDFCLRAAQAGYQLVYVPAAQVWHRAAHSTTGRRNYSPYGVYFATRNALLLMRKQGHRAGWLLFVPLFALRLLRRWVIYQAQRQPQATRAMVWGIVDFLQGQVRAGRMEFFVRDYMEG